MDRIGESGAESRGDRIEFVRLDPDPRQRPAAAPGFMFPFSARALQLFGAAGHIAASRGLSALLTAGGVRMLADAMNRMSGGATAVRPGDLCAVGLICNILHFVSMLYRRSQNPAMLENALEAVGTSLGPDAANHAVGSFLESFPPPEVALGRTAAPDFGASATGGIPNRLLALEAVLLLRIFNQNPAFRPFKDLFDDDALAKDPICAGVVAQVEAFLDTQPGFGPFRQPLHRMLRTPAEVSPYSLEGQLDYIRKNWGLDVLGELWESLLRGLDLVREEKNVFSPSPGPAQSAFAATGREYAFEPEAFSADLDWMPSVVLIAKSVYVWLFQLSGKYGRSISRLDQIPDEELDLLARWGFTGLWLIGLWERSPASKDIKRRMGNPEAEASAYSVYEYEIAADLGGEGAFQNLKDRAMRRGIRLAGDMVPNHMGVFSRWVVERPDLFMDREDPPFPWYTFSGPDLSLDGRVCIQIEDKYWSRQDAAVVFRRTDRSSGTARYIYHGNDGTGMPWNDTAQLDYLKPETRRAVTETILRVASKFPIIRFDAAMTLTKRHFQRLWFPEPGDGGAIPTRAEYGLAKSRFDEAFPVEFWREVVDTVAARAPDTLLLAEAFWLMEGFFVRTLGMHRVYNSAFMNMLKTEDNAKYRQVLKNVLDFNPEVLRRFVNFMNNPDEDTAVAQFGMDDKYFGVATLMCTLPGLPMFGHGQIEGFTEKYGMEYRRSYRDERPDPALVQRHERDIFPLLRRRRIWSGVENFRLFDFERHDGGVNEDVFAFSNRLGGERGLVVYNNRWNHASGRVRNAVLGLGTLMSALGFDSRPDTCIAFRDHASGLHFLTASESMAQNGLPFELGAFKCRVSLDFRELRGEDYVRLSLRLGGAPVPDIEEALRIMLLEDAGRSFEALFRAAAEDWAAPEPAAEAPADRFLAGMRGIAAECARVPGFPSPAPGALERSASLLRGLPGIAKRGRGSDSSPPRPALHERFFGGDLAFVFGAALSCAAAMRALSPAGGPPPGLNLPQIAGRAASSRGESSGQTASFLAEILFAVLRDDPARPGRGDLGIQAVLGLPACREFLGFNSWDGVLWFSKEPFENLVSALAALSLLQAASSSHPGDGLAAAFEKTRAEAEALVSAAAASGYQVDLLLESLRPPPPTAESGS